MPAGEVLRHGPKWGDRPVARALRARVSGQGTGGLPLVGRAGTADLGATGAAPRAPFFSAGFVVGGLLAVLVVVLWRATESYSTGVFDFYPLYYGAKAWLHSGDAYTLAGVAPASHQSNPLYQVGNVYPLPAVLVVLPLSLLPGKVAAMVWLGSLTAGLLLALRLNGLHYAFMFYWPLLNGLNLEQYTVLIVILQLVALWAYRERRLWLLAVCCTLILTKPNHGLAFVIVLLLLARHWRQQLVVGAAVWGGSLLLDPNWIAEWIPTLYRHHELTQQPVHWWLGLLAVPLLLARNYIGGAIVAQFALMPWPLLAYPASSVPLSVLEDRRSIWLMPLSFLWIFVYSAADEAWATALTLILPVIVLSFLRQREQAGTAGWPFRARPAVG